MDSCWFVAGGDRHLCLYGTPAVRFVSLKDGFPVPSDSKARGLSFPRLAPHPTQPHPTRNRCPNLPFPVDANSTWESIMTSVGENL